MLFLFNNSKVLILFAFFSSIASKKVDRHVILKINYITRACLMPLPVIHNDVQSLTKQLASCSKEFVIEKDAKTTSIARTLGQECKGKFISQ